MIILRSFSRRPYTTEYVFEISSDSISFSMPMDEVERFASISGVHYQLYPDGKAVEISIEQSANFSPSGSIKNFWVDKYAMFSYVRLFTRNKWGV